MGTWTARSRGKLFKWETMNEEPATLRSETLALDALIQETVARAQAEADSDSADTLVFLGNRHQSFPTAVVKDPVLEPVDKLVWMVVMLSVHETGGNTAFPGYESIGKLANVSSRATIARAITILRATRWLTLCTRIRKASGRFHRNIYALHDEPLPVADALHLNAGYMDFLNHALGHAHARVRAVSQAVLNLIDEEFQAGQEICTQSHDSQRQSLLATKGQAPHRYFTLAQNIVRRLRSDTTQVRKKAMHQEQNLNMAGDQVHILNAQNMNLVRSSSYINITTTTQTGERSKFELGGEDDRPLVYPPRLCDKHREIADRHLSALAPEQRQPILDELEGRFRAESKGMKPVYDEIGFLQSLCTLANKGKFQPNLGIKVQNTRLEREKEHRRSLLIGSVNSAKETKEQRKKRMETGQERLSVMKKVLGMRTSRVSDRADRQS